MLLLALRFSYSSKMCHYHFNVTSWHCCCWSGTLNTGWLLINLLMNLPLIKPLLTTGCLSRKCFFVAASLTYFIHQHNLILADARAGVVLKQFAPLEVLTLHTLPLRSKNTSQAISTFRIVFRTPNMTSLCADSLLHGAGIRAGGTLVTCGTVGAGLGALTGPAHTLASPAAQQAQVGHAGVSASGAVAVFTLPVWCTLTEATVTDAMTCERRKKQWGKNTTIYNLNTDFTTK